MDLDQFLEKEAWKYACEACQGVGTLESKSRFGGGFAWRICKRCNGSGLDPEDKEKFEALLTELTAYPGE